MTAYRLDQVRGTLEAFQTISTLPEGYAGENSCAQIRIHPAGEFLYVSNRGHDSIVCISIDQTTGRLSALGWQPTEPVPRAFNLDPNGRHLFVAGQESGNLARYEIDQMTGRLVFLDSFRIGETPLWITVLTL